MAENRRHGEFPEVWIRLIYLIVAATGGINWLISMLELEVSSYLIFGTICLSSFWFFGVFGGRWKLKVTLPVTFGFVGICIYTGHHSLVNGLAMILNKVSVFAKKYYKTEFGLFEAEYRILDMENMLYLLSFLLVMLLAYGIIRRRRIGIMCFISVMLLCFSLSINCFPDIKAFMMWTCACLGLRAMGGRNPGNGNSYIQGRAGKWMLGFSVLLLAAAYLLILPRIEDTFVLNHQKVMVHQRKLELKIEDLMLQSPFSGWDIFSDFTWQGKVESGTLTNSSPGRTGRTALTVTMEEVPDNNFYMKGFIGGIYDGDRWIEISDEDFDETVKNQWNTEISAEHLKTDLLNWPYDYMNNMGLGEKAAYQVDLKEVNGRYGYLPYYTNTEDLVGKVLDTEADGLTVRKTDKMSYEGFQGSNFWNREIVTSLLSAGLYPYSNADNEMLQSYERYVEQHYLYVPADGIDRLKDVCEQLKLRLDENGIFINELGYKDYVVAVIKSILASQCTYSTTLQPLPEGQDYTDYFLFDQKKGFCTHFASTGVLMFRQLGIPARYATGYVVRPREFKRDKGKDTYTAEVPDGNAHAWVEIYDENVGWIPVEVTPGYYYSNDNENNDEKQVKEVISTPEPAEEKKPSETPEATKSPESDNEKKTPESKDSKGSNKEALPNRNLMLAAGMLGGFVILSGGVCIRRRLLLKRRRSRFDRNNRQAIMNISYETYQMLKSAGFKQLSHISDDVYGKEIQETFPCLEKNEFIEFVKTAQKAKFSRENFTQDEVIFCQSVYKKLDQSLYDGLGRLKKFWWRFIKCYS